MDGLLRFLNVPEQAFILFFCVHQQPGAVALGVDGPCSLQTQQHQIPAALPSLTAEIELTGKQSPGIFPRAWAIFGQTGIGPEPAAEEPQFSGTAQKEIKQEAQPGHKGEDQKPGQCAAHLFFAEKQDGNCSHHIEKIEQKQ